MINLKNYGTISKDQYIANYFRVRNKVKEVVKLHREGDESFCEICFSTSCNHKCGKDNYQDALQQLSWWEGTLFSYLQEDSPVVNDSIIPSWPTPKKYNPNIIYTVTPAINEEMYCIVVDDYGITGLDLAGNVKLDLTYFMNIRRNKIANGVYYGHWIEDSFWLICAFRDGLWVELQRFSRLPRITLEEDVKPEINIPKEMKKYINGFWFLPIPSNHSTFSQYLFFRETI